MKQQQMKIPFVEVGELSGNSSPESFKNLVSRIFGNRRFGPFDRLVAICNGCHRVGLYRPSQLTKRCSRQSTQKTVAVGEGGSTVITISRCGGRLIPTGEVQPGLNFDER